MPRLLHHLAFALCLSGTLAAAVKVVQSELLAPATFGRPELEQWLKTPSISHERSADAVIAERLAARQLARDFHAGFDWQPTFEQTTSAEQQILATNFRRLLLALVEQRADAYAALPSHHRDRFLDNELNDLAKWYVVGPEGRQFGLGLFQKSWLSNNSGALQSYASPKVRNFATAMESHLLKRSIGRMLPLVGEKRPRDD